MIRGMKAERSLAYQLVSYILILMLVVFAVVTISTQAIFNRHIRKTQLNNMRHLAHERIYLIDGILENIQSHLLMLQHTLSSQNIMPKDTQSLVSGAINSNRNIHSITIAEKSGTDYHASVYYQESGKLLRKIVRDRNYFYEDWFQIPLMLQEPYWTEPWVDSRGSQELIISHSIPFERPGSSGIVSIGVCLKELQKLVTDNACMHSGTGFLISANGTIVAYKDMALVMNHSLFSLADEYEDPRLALLGDKMIATEEGFIDIKGGTVFQNSWIYYQPLKTNHWSVGVSLGYDVLYKEMRILLLINVFASLLIFLVVAIIIYSRAMALTKPLKELSTTALRIGEGEFDVRIPSSDAGLEITTLSQSFRFMQESLLDYIHNLRITTFEKDKIKGDVIYAGEVQTKLIPKNTDHPYGIRDLRAYGILEPAGDVGGDLYDYFMVDEDRFCFVIADVVGKGIVAAMTMTMASTLLPSLAPFYKSSDELLMQLNSFLCKNDIESNFITALLGIIDLRSGTLQYSNAGHTPLYIRKLDGEIVKYGETHSTALGVFSDLNIGYDEVELNVGDEIILFTDGVTEAMSVEDEFFGIGGLEAVLARLRYSNPEKTAKAILDEVNEFARNSKYKDDITLLVIDYKYPGV